MGIEVVEAKLLQKMRTRNERRKKLRHDAAAIADVALALASRGRERKFAATHTPD
jgi:hypothetical protein